MPPVTSIATRGVERLEILVVGQRRPPVDHLWQRVRVRAARTSDWRLSSSRQIRDHFTAPSVRPAMKCFCIRKNISTGGIAATIEPAETRCHCAIHWPLSE